MGNAAQKTHSDGSKAIQVIGLTRWSYPFRGRGLRQVSEDLHALRAALYAPARLDHRLFLLRHVLLPGLRAQTDLHFTHLVLIGDQLPDPWRSEVLSLLAEIPQIVPVIAPEGEGHRDLCRDVIRAHIDPSAEVTAQYRLDDDDGLAVSFVETVRHLFADLQPFHDRAGSVALDFTRGFVLDTSSPQIRINPVSMRFWAPGMAVFQPPASERSVMDFNHLKIWHHMPCLTWPDAPMFVRGRHADNDSGLGEFGRRTRGFRLEAQDMDAYFSQSFALDLPRLKAAWREHAAGPINPPHAPLTTK